MNLFRGGCLGWCALALVLTFLSESRSHACTCSFLDHGFLASGEVRLPANARGLPWWGPFDIADGEVSHPPHGAFEVAELRGGSAIPVEFDLEVVSSPLLRREPPSARDQLILIVPRHGLVADNRYLFTYEYRPKNSATVKEAPTHTQTAIVEVSAESFPAPNESARVNFWLDERKPLRTATRAGSCSTFMVPRQRGVEFSSPSARRWTNGLLYSVFVNGRLWRPERDLCMPTPPGRSWVEVGREVLYTSCKDVRSFDAPPVDNLEEGVHRVQMYAWLPGTESQLETKVEISLRCY